MATRHGKLALAVLAGVLALQVGRTMLWAADAPAATATAPANTLTDAEKQAGWKLLFDGKTTDGWNNFKKETINVGWQVKDGTLAVVDPKKAGDLVTKEQFDWFELSLDYNISKGGNSGIMFHITTDGGAMWQTGPEVQLQDNIEWHDPELSGWIYALYKPAADPRTNKPLDATRPPGEWNNIRVIIDKQKCEVVMNGTKYYDFVLGSDDFKARVAKSKFAGMKLFAKFDKGFIGLQGDHGQVAFRNIKIRPIESK